MASANVVDVAATGVLVMEVLVVIKTFLIYAATIFLLLFANPVVVVLASQIPLMHVLENETHRFFVTVPFGLSYYYVWNKLNTHFYRKSEIVRNLFNAFT